MCIDNRLSDKDLELYEAFIDRQFHKVSNSPTMVIRKDFFQALKNRQLKLDNLIKEISEELDKTYGMDNPEAFIIRRIKTILLENKLR